MNEYEQAIADYKALPETASHRERAEAEDKVYQLMGNALRAEYQRQPDRAVGAVLGVPASHVRHRRDIFRLGDQAAVQLWAEVDTTMPLTTGGNLARAARHRAQAEMGLSTLQALQRELQSYFRLPAVHLANGKILHKQTPNARKKGSAKVRHRKGPKPFWAEVRNLVAEFVAERLHGVSELEQERLWATFEAELREVVDSFQARLSAARRDAKERIHVTKREMRDACEVLCMDPPVFGKAPDLAFAKRQKRTLARAYHPDVTGNDSMRPQYQAVLDAYVVLERYAAQCSRQQQTPNGNH